MIKSIAENSSKVIAETLADPKKKVFFDINDVIGITDREGGSTIVLGAPGSPIMMDVKESVDDIVDFLITAANAQREARQAQQEAGMKALAEMQAKATKTTEKK